MATSASGGASSATSERRGSRQAVPLCPFCRTPTVVERMSRTVNHPDMPFYKCKNGDWGSNKKCDFFMWKPEAPADSNPATDLTTSISSAHQAVLELTKQLAAKPAESKCLLIAPWWIKIAGLAVVGVNLITMAMLLSSNGTCSY